MKKNDVENEQEKKQIVKNSLAAALRKNLLRRKKATINNDIQRNSTNKHEK